MLLVTALVRGVMASARTPVALVRRHREIRDPLDLDRSYYPARGSRGYELVPKDAFMAEVEALLEEVTRPPA